MKTLTAARDAAVQQADAIAKTGAVTLAELRAETSAEEKAQGLTKVYADPDYKTAETMAIEGRKAKELAFKKS